MSTHHDDRDLEERLHDLAALAEHVPPHRRTQLDLLVRRLERFLDTYAAGGSRWDR